MEAILFDAVISAMIRSVGATDASADSPLKDIAIIVYIPRSPQITPEAPIDLAYGDFILWIKQENRPPTIMMIP